MMPNKRALLPELLPDTKKTRFPSQDTASGTGGATGTRTPDPLLANLMVCQQSGVRRNLIACPNAE
jgi:hypothetical protein